MPPSLGFQLFGQTAANLVEDQAHKRFCAADVRGRHDKVQRRRRHSLHQIADAPIALARDGRHDRIAIETKERHGGGEHAELAMTGCTPRSPRCAVVIIARSVISIGRRGSERKLATPARVLSDSA